jgi:pyruvate, orthophosphate dikinase
VLPCAASRRPCSAASATPKRPLLLSVRSGAAVSMPGMMDTVLNLGINDRVAEALAASGNARFAFDAYRRFIDMFGDVVVGVPHARFEEALERLKEERGRVDDADLDEDDLRELVDRYQALYRRMTSRMFPEDPREQLHLAVDAVFRSWNSHRATRYRQINGITGLIGTAVNVQGMVYGNLGEGSGTGVCFSRDPSTGENVLFGEFLRNAQGEDVVAGIRTPQPIDEMELAFPECYHQLEAHPAAGAALRGDAGHRVHHPGWGAVHPPDPNRQAYRRGGRADRRRPGERRPGHEEHAVRSLVSPAHLDQLLHPASRTIRRTSLASWASAWPPHRVRPSGGWSSMPAMPKHAPRMDRQSSSCASRRARKTSAAWTPPGAS